jgi:hypothetical protein
VIRVADNAGKSPNKLLVAEIALALVVLTGAGLMTRTMYKIAKPATTFQAEQA